MKKSFVILAICLLLTGLVLASENETPNDSENKTSLKDKISNSFNSTKSNLHSNNSVLNNLSNFNFTSNRSKDENSTLKQNITVPSELSFIIPVLNGIGGPENITWGELITALLVFVFVFLFIYEATSYTVMETPVMRLLVTLGVSAIATVMGGLSWLIALFSLGLSNLKGILTLVAVILVFGFIIRPILHKIQKKRKIDKAERLGTAAGVAYGSMEETTEELADTVENTQSTPFKYEAGMRRGTGMRSENGNVDKGHGTIKYVKSQKSGKRDKVRKGYVNNGSFVSKRATERYAKMWGDDAAKKRFGKGSSNQS